MARSARPSSAFGAALRAQLAEHHRKWLDRMPNSAHHKAGLQAATGTTPIIVDSGTMHGLLFAMGEVVAARRFRHAADPQDRRRFLLGADNQLTEIDPEEIN